MAGEQWNPDVTQAWWNTIEINHIYDALPPISGVIQPLRLLWPIPDSRSHPASTYDCEGHIASITGSYSGFYFSGSGTDTSGRTVNTTANCSASTMQLKVGDEGITWPSTAKAVIVNKVELEVVGDTWDNEKDAIIPFQHTVSIVGGFTVENLMVYISRENMNARFQISVPSMGDQFSRYYSGSLDNCPKPGSSITVYPYMYGWWVY